MLHRPLRTAGRVASRLGLPRLASTLHARADRAVIRPRRRRTPGTHADNGARWATSQFFVGAVLALLYLAAAALGLVPLP